MAKKKEDANTLASAKKPRLVRVLLKNFNHGKKSTKNLAKMQNKIKKKNEFCEQF